jgi:predicted transcriptional regulator
MSKIKPKKWTEVYPVGTKEGDEEARFFRSLARNPKYDWRSVAALSKESNLSKSRVEEIINKYYKMGIVFQNPKNEDHWGYWERLQHLLPDKKTSVCQNDKDERIQKSLNK